MGSTETTRQQKLDDLRALVDFLETHPDVPLGYGSGLSYHVTADDDAAGIKRVSEIAGLLGVTVTEVGGGEVTAATSHFHARKTYGDAAYEAVYITGDSKRRYREHMQPYDEAERARREASAS